MNAPGNENECRSLIETLLADLLQGRCSRAEAAAWAEALERERPEIVAQLGNGAVREAFSALASADRCEQPLDRRGAPYFIRDDDLREWLAALRGEDLQVTLPTGLRVRRPHEVRALPGLTASLDCKLDEISRRAGVRAIRGKDDLDYFEHLLFELPAGQQASLIGHARSPFTEVYLEASDDPEGVLASLLRLLGVAPDTLIRND